MAAGPAVHIEGLTYDYGGEKLVLEDVNLDLPTGARCLLVGINGTGKSTLLRILAGKHLVKAPVLVLGQHSYFATPDGLTFLGSEWANNPIVRSDLRVDRLVSSVGGDEFPSRRDFFYELLDIDPLWHMHTVSDGQRRRVQLLMGLVRPWRVLLLDEITTDLDVICRHDFVEYLRRETDENGATVVYATHIFDGLGSWATHVCHLSNGRVRRFAALEDVDELRELAVAPAGPRSWAASPLLLLMEMWLRQELVDKKAKDALRRSQPAPAPTPLEIKRDDTKQFGFKFYNYWAAPPQ
eukprot:a685808_125.p1 GENE.a685808_125~~a685808_125.p1  ORF type:complete len:308 (+),score=113.58 a685808_125:37-924(+)